MSLLFSSLLSLIIGTVVGLTQFRIKRLYAFSTISHIGFILLALTIHSVESIQAFMFYLMQYSISNLNAFILIITIGYSLYCYTYKDNETSEKNYSEKNNSEKNYSDKETNDITNQSSFEKNTIKYVDNTYDKIETNGLMEVERGKMENTNNENNDNNLQDINNSPIQLINQLKGYYYINSFLSLSLAITLFSFVGIPPLIGFFGKQMILSAAIENGYIFMSLVAILTSVISAVYYLSIIKQIFFDKPDFIINTDLFDYKADGIITEKNIITEKIIIKTENIVVSSSLSLPISIITLIITLFIFIPQE